MCLLGAWHWEEGCRSACRVLVIPCTCPVPHSLCAERVLPSIIQETLKSVIAQYNASQLLTMREVRSAGSTAGSVGSCWLSMQLGGGRTLAAVRAPLSCSAGHSPPPHSAPLLNPPSMPCRWSAATSGGY